MDKLKISIINGVELIAVRDEDGNVFVPVKPICEAIGVRFDTQFAKLQEHPILASTIALRATVGFDGKEREMVCLPLEFVYGWIFTINPKNVSESARANVIKYQMECYKALYFYFSVPLRERQEADRKEKELTDRIAEYKAKEKEFRTIRMKAEAELQSSREQRLKDIP